MDAALAQATEHTRTTEDDASTAVSSASIVITASPWQASATWAAWRAPSSTNFCALLDVRL